MIVLVQIERQEIGTVAVTWIQQIILERKRKNQLQLKVRFPSTITIRIEKKFP
jgi:hypothetical protein